MRKNGRFLLYVNDVKLRIMKSLLEGGNQKMALWLCGLGMFGHNCGRLNRFVLSTPNKEL